MTRYRIYTERFPTLPDLVSNFFDGFTILEATGYWKGEKEESVVIEVLDNGVLAESRVNALIRKIKEKYNQDSVLVTHEVEGELV